MQVGFNVPTSGALIEPDCLTRIITAGALILRGAAQGVVRSATSPGVDTSSIALPMIAAAPGEATWDV